MLLEIPPHHNPPFHLRFISIPPQPRHLITLPRLRRPLRPNTDGVTNNRIQNHPFVDSSLGLSREHYALEIIHFRVCC